MRLVLLALLLSQSITAMDPTGSSGIIDNDTILAAAIISSTCCVVTTAANVCLCRYIRRQRREWARQDAMTPAQRDAENMMAIIDIQERLDDSKHNG